MGRLSIFEKRKMAIEELIKYYSEYRKIEFNNGEELKGIELRKKIHLLIKIISKLDELMSKEKKLLLTMLERKKIIYLKYMIVLILAVMIFKEPFKLLVIRRT